MAKNEIDNSYIDYLRGKFGIRQYRKKPLVIEAYQINEDFSVETLEGYMNGKAGDYVMVGIKGELYICDQNIFKETYDKVEE